MAIERPRTQNQATTTLERVELAYLAPRSLGLVLHHIPMYTPSCCGASPLVPTLTAMQLRPRHPRVLPLLRRRINQSHTPLAADPMTPRAALFSPRRRLRPFVPSLATAHDMAQTSVVSHSRFSQSVP